MRIRSAVMMAGSVLAFNVQAAVINWGEHDAVETANKVAPIGSFAGRYLFTLSAPSTALDVALVNKLRGEHGIEKGLVKLYEEAGDVDLLLGKFAFKDINGPKRHSWGTLDAGNYYYRVSGNGVGVNGGLYTIKSMAAPTAVPEPATYALLLCGLGVIGLVARRRRPGSESG